MVTPFNVVLEESVALISTDVILNTNFQKSIALVVPAQKDELETNLMKLKIPDIGGKNSFISYRIFLQPSLENPDILSRIL